MSRSSSLALALALLPLPAHAILGGQRVNDEGSGFLSIRGSTWTCTAVLVAGDVALSGRHCFTEEERLHPEALGWFMGREDSDDNPIVEIAFHPDPRVGVALLRLRRPIAGTVREIDPGEPARLAGRGLTCLGYGELAPNVRPAYGTSLSQGDIRVTSVGLPYLNWDQPLFTWQDDGGACLLREGGREYLAGLIMRPRGATSVPELISAAVLRGAVAEFRETRSIVSVATGLCLDASKGAVRLSACQGLPGQRWRLHQAESGAYELRPGGGNMCRRCPRGPGVCAERQGRGQEAATLVLGDCGGELTRPRPLPRVRPPEQLFSVPDRDGGPGPIKSALTGHCLEATGGAVSGAVPGFGGFGGVVPVQLAERPCREALAQRWRLGP